MAENSLAAHRRRIALALTALVLTACDQQEEAPREPVAAGAAVTLPPEPGCTTQIYNDHEYWFCPTDHTALEARALCAEQPWMHLVRIDDEDERDFLEGHFDGHAWIGGTDELTEGDWRWLDDGDAFWMGAAGGSPVAGRYADWVSGQPDNLTAVTPPAAMLTQLWDPDHASITDPVGSCTIHGWGDSAYWTCSSLLSWDTSRSRCTTAGADLTSITSSAESDFVNAIATGTNEWHIGVQKRGLAGAPMGTWQWLDGGNPITGFSNWGIGEPGSSNCGVMENDRWKDWSCTSIEAFICEDTSVLPIPDAHGPQLVDLMTAQRWFAGSTSALTNGVNVATGCGASAGAPDAVFWFNLASATHVSIDLHHTTFGSAVVSLFKGTLNGAGYAAAGSHCAVRGAAGVVELSLDLTAGSYYAVVTSTSSSGAGTYDIKFDSTLQGDCTLAEQGEGWSDDTCNSPNALHGYICESDVSDCTVGVDSDEDGVPDCFDGCPEDASHRTEGQCGCPSSPAAAATACDDGICPANIWCDGAGNCGDPAECAPDTNCTYLQEGDTGYYFCENARTADEARAQCTLQPGMHLVHVDDEQENQLLVDHNENGTWLNATDEGVEGYWVWADDGSAFWEGGTDGSPVMDRFSDWLHDDAPDNLDGLGWPIADCAALENGLPAPQTSAWSDFACNDSRQTFGFTCEIPLEQGCLLESDLDEDGTLDCRDTCPLDPGKVVPGDCGCADAPAGEGTACDDGWCAANDECDGAGTCGDPADCAPTSGCTPARYEGKAYWFCGGSHSWTQARDLCRAKSGLELVRIDDEDENAFVAGKIAATSWIGANDRSVNNTWRWAQAPNDNGAQFWSGTSSGSASNGLFSHWASGEPGSTLADCGQIQTAGTWRDLSCSSTSGFVCETVLDHCPLDSVKFEPGECGCGVADTDTDNDGAPNCHDECPSDPNKTSPLWCGCGNPDTDSDGDETADCVDGCPDDEGKVSEGICGCGTPDDDSDGDGTLDCEDLCADDPLKSAPGVCGCNLTDVDTDGDETPDCTDLCPMDPAKVHPGPCGCGVADIDSDGDHTFDCLDECPNDADKAAAGDCGCTDDPEPVGTACDDGLCAANEECNGAGQCGTYEECAPEPGCTVEQVSGRVYFHCPGPVTWDSAEAACAGPGFQQVRIDSAAEDAHFDVLEDDIWLGARDYSEGTWTWHDGTDEPFWSGGPDGSPIGSRFNDWGTEQPDDLYGSIVYPATATLTQLWDENATGAMKPTGTCSGHIRNAELYWRCSNVIGWDTARSRCITAGSNLASINDAAENAFIVGLVGNDDTLIGLQKKGLGGGPNGTWQWLDGTNPNGSYSNWGSFEPGFLDCGMIEDGVWKDFSCIALEEWICERPTTPLPLPRLAAPQSVNVYGAQRWFRGSTSGMQSSVDGTIMTGCGAGAAAPDAVFAFTLTERTHVSISLSGSDAGTRVGIFKGTVDATGFSQAGNECVSAGTVLEETLDAGSYFAVITSNGTSARRYEALFTGVRQGQPGADCALLRDGVWVDTNCGEAYAYTCEVPVDECPADGTKLVPGACGCGNPDADTDGDSLPDCIDRCPLDANQVEPGDCGCASAPKFDGTPCDTGLCLANDICDGAGRCGDPMDCAPSPDCVFAEYAGMASRGYFFCSDAQSWAGALASCASQPRMQLARIDDPTENAFIASTQAAQSWIGANDHEDEGEWFWHDGGDDEGAQFWTGDENGSGVGGLYTNWDPAQPNDLLTQDCGEIQANGLWNDDSCGNGHDYVCEIGADLCPDDRYKWEPGECGCGFTEDESDGDGVKDCFDSCPYDAERVVPAEGHCAFTHVGDVLRADRSAITHAMAADGNGETLFVWQAVVGSNSAVHGRRFDQNGTPIDWAPIVIDARVGLGKSAEPRVAGRPGGGWIVVWTDDGGDADRDGIAYALIDAEGALSEVGVASDEPLLREWSGRVAALDEGFVIVWVDQQLEGSEDTGTALRARLFDDQGLPLGPAFAVADTVIGDQLTPDVAASGPDWMVVWADLDTTSVLGRRFAGELPSEEIVIAAGAHSPAVTALTEAGDFAVAFVDASAATYASRVPAGLEPDPAVRVAQVVDGRPEQLPALALFEGDAFVVAFQYGEGHRDSDFDVVDPLGVAPALPDATIVRAFLSGAGNQSQVAVAHTQTGMWIAWIDDSLGFGEDEAELAAYFIPAP